MFGYIVPKVCELRVREYELFRAYYCGLCKALAGKYKRSAVLNFRTAFFHILLADSLQNEETVIQPCKCGFHPFGKREKIVSPAAEYASDINILMAYFKAGDDVRDGKTGRIKRLLLKRAYGWAAQAHPQIAFLAERTIGELKRLEDEKSANTDAAADTYAQLLAAVFENAECAPVAYPARSRI